MMITVRCQTCGGRSRYDDTVWHNGRPFHHWWRNDRHQLCDTCYVAAFPAQPLALDGGALRDDALQRVEDHAPVTWIDAARKMVKELAMRQEVVTSDDLWLSGLAKPPEPRALGAVFMWAARQGLLKNTNTTTPTSQPQAHKRPIAVWSSLIYGLPA
jgi:hypothetical protein